MSVYKPSVHGFEPRRLFAVQRCDDLSFLLPADPGAPVEWVGGLANAELFDFEDQAQDALEVVTRAGVDRACLVEVEATVKGVGPHNGVPR